MKISYLLCISHFIKLIYSFIYQIYTFALIPSGAVMNALNIVVQESWNMNTWFSPKLYI